MATHSSIPAWRIPVNGGAYSPRGHKESDTTEVTERAHTQMYMCIYSFSFLGLLAKIKCGMGASQVALVVNNLDANVGDIRDAGSIPGLGRSPRGGHGNPL